jgi:hypothetical protein
VRGINRTNKFSRIAVVAKRDNGAGMGISDTRDDTSGGAAWYIDLSERLTLDKAFVINIGQTAALPELAGASAFGANTVGVTYDGSVCKFYINGRAVANATAPTSQTFSFTTGTLFRGSNVVGSAGAANEIGLHADFDIPLSDELMLEFTGNPWAMFEPVSVYVNWPAAAAPAGNRRRRFFLGAAA